MPTSPDTPEKVAHSPIRVRFDRFELDEANASLTRDGQPIALPPTPFAVLCALARQQGNLVTKNGLLDEVWGHRFVTESVLKTVIGKLRAALDDDARRPRIIETVSRRGYRFIAAAESVAAAGIPHSALDVEPAPPEGGSDFIGRAGELARLRASWRRAGSGRRSVAWLAGDPGIGKTTLIERFLAELGPVACARGQCVEQYGAGEPYLPVLEAVGQLCRQDAAAVPLLRAVAPAWLVQMPWLSPPEEREALRRELAGLGADRMMREMAEFLERYAEGAPLLLVTEDLHWSDRSTVQLLDYVARRRSPARFMWLATFRLSEVVALDHPLSRIRHELLVHGLADELVLDPFSESEVAQFVARVSPASGGDEAFVRALHERTDGLPLFVSHLLTDVAESAGVGPARLAARDVAGLAVPERLAALIDHYIVRLSPDERALLSAAAVCGTEFRIGTLSRVMGMEASAAAQACEALSRSRLLAARGQAPAGEAGVGAFAFRHSLFRQVLYERIPAPERATLHLAAASALEAERAGGTAVASVELAMHGERGGDPAAAARHYADAAEAALFNYTPDEAVALAEHGLRALERAGRFGERDALEVSLATVAGAAVGHLRGESVAEAKAWLSRAYARLERVPDHRLRASLLHMLGVALVLRGEYGEALPVAEAMQSLSESRHDRLLMRPACAIRGQALMLQGRPASSREWLERGLATLPALGDPASEDALAIEPRATLLSLLSLVSLHLGLVRQARERIAEAHEVAVGGGQPVAIMVAIWIDALLEVRLGNPRRVAELAGRMEALVEKYGLGLGRTAVGWLRGWSLAKTGSPRDGFALIRRAHEENLRLDNRAGGSEVVGYAVEALLLAGDPEGAALQLDEAMGITRSLGERIYLPQLLALQSRLARVRGDDREAEAALRRAIAEAREQEAPWLELGARLELCEAGGAAEPDFGELESLVARMSEAQGTEAVARARALLARR